MKTLTSCRLRLASLLTLVSLLLTACQTLDYRQIQNDFNQSVQAENSGVPFMDQHLSVLQSLTPEYIAKLDPKLRPNAWMLRAVSAWRVSSNELADESVIRGLKEPALVAGSRDQIILEMVPALVIDSDLRRRWNEAGQTLAATEYRQTYEVGFKAAWNRLSNNAGPAINRATSDDVLAYFHYQRWRLIINWNAVVGSVQPEDEAREARRRAATFLGVSDVASGPLLEAARREAAQIPQGNALRELIKAQGGG